MKLSAILAVFLSALVLLIAGACDANPPCDRLPSSIVFFPEQKSQEGGMEALLWGELVLTNGLLRIQTDQFVGNVSYLPLWPPGYSVCEEDGTIQLFKGGDVIAKLGEEIYMGGGELSIQSANDLLVDPLPLYAEGPYWLVGKEVRLNIR